MRESIKVLHSLGYNKELIEKILTTYPIYNLKDETLALKIKRIYNFLLGIGYTREEVIKITKQLPILYGLSEQSIINKINFLISLGYIKEEVIKMTKQLPAIYSYSEENITNKINFLISLGYIKEEVIKMTKQLPTLYGLSEENIKEKIEYLRSVDLEFIALEYTKYLMQSTKLTYARYEFLTKEKKTKIDEVNFGKLFYGQKVFKKKYGITNEELFEIYDFESKKGDKTYD